MGDECHGRRKWTYKEAERRARKLRRREHRPLTPYRCEMCGGWHIGQRHA